MRIRCAHVSMQFSDTDAQHTYDIEKIFARGRKMKYAWIMGTEGGPGTGNTAKELVRVGKNAGYRTWVPNEQAKDGGRSTDSWIAVREDLVVSGWKQKYAPVIPGSAQLYKDQGRNPDIKPHWGPRGVVSVEFQSTPELGPIGLAVGHHLTNGRHNGPDSVIHGVDHWEWNQKLDDAFAKWMSETGKGRALAFASFDRNASDRRNPANVENSTTLADELKAWQNTGHGDIDWILSFNKDSRVQGHRFTVLDDKEFFLHTDHFFLEGVFNVAPLKH